MTTEQKIQALGIALIKISVNAKRWELRHRLERQAFDLIERLAEENFTDLKHQLKAVDNLVKFGGLLYEIENMHVRGVREWIDEINLEFKSKNQENDNLPDLDQIFEKNRVTSPVESQKNEPGNEMRQNTAIAELNKEKYLNNEINNSAIRQSVIVDRIKQSGPQTQVQLKDIVQALPNVSERTIRYDLQKLCSDGILERVGQGGPGTYYRIRVI